MPNYSDGKIYKIVDNTTDEVYIGSTTQTLCKRKGGHESSYKFYLKGKGYYVTSFNIIKNRNYRIVLIENFPCLDKSQLHEREGYWVRNIDCVNKVIPKRTKIEYNKQYYEKNKECFSEYRKQYNENNKEWRKQYDKKYGEANKESIKQYQKKYKEANKDKIKATSAIKFTCDCSAVITNGAKSNHVKTKKHQNYLKSTQ